jgi:orotate phosphoribosyltransferase
MNGGKGAMLELMRARYGHFPLESGHHGNLWLDVDAAFIRPTRLSPTIADLAGRVARHGPDAVCGPLIGGALAAQLIAVELDIECYFAERISLGSGLYTAEYRIGRPLSGKRVAVVDDVINAGSAVRSTMADIERNGGTTVALAALLVLGTPAAALAADRGIPLEYAESADNVIWPPDECPLCQSRRPLD